MQETTRLSVCDGVATLCLNRPEKHNAFDDTVIQELLTHLKRLADQPGLRALVLKAEGKHFCAGADLAWMKRMATLTHDENLTDAQQLAALMAALNDFPAPTICRVQGAAYGGAIGLIACCDIAIASENARFCLSEVKLGLAPATIAPYVVAAMGARTCRRLFLTAEVFDAPTAKQSGLLHQVVTLGELDQSVDAMLSHILRTGPVASRAAKQLVKRLSDVETDVASWTSALISDLRVSEEGQEGLGAFFEKRTPSWINED